MTALLPDLVAEPADVAGALHRGAGHLVSLLHDRGCWEGEMRWCTMILSQYVIVQHVLNRPIPDADRAGMRRHYEVTQTPDGGWGLHPESGGYVFVTTLAYVALRLLDFSADDPLPARARAWLHAQPGGVPGIPTWGKFWLALVGLYGYEGVNPFPPELFILPRALPFHPDRFYCHTRNIYQAISYLYGSRFRADLGRLGEALRGELYGTPDTPIRFAEHRHHLAPTDLYVRPSGLLRAAYDALHAYERVHSRQLREKALDRCFDRILYEQRTSGHQAVSPVNGLLNCLAIASRDPHHPELQPSLEGLESWRWEDDAAGIRYVGARSHAWDTAFAMQALLACPEAAGRHAEALRAGYRFLRDTQITKEVPDREAGRRDPALGGWCFSDGQHRWPVSDCTAEAVTALLQMHTVPGVAPEPGDRIPEERLRWAAEFILYRQNRDGGFGTYERRRASSLLERVNPSEMYRDCMTERSYLECTASCVAALAHLREAHPHLLPQRIQGAVSRGVRFLRGAQRADGSFPGFWGIHFTYGAFHVLRALRTAGVPAGDPCLQRAAAWLAGKQRADGSWGEHHSGCLEDRYVEHPEGQPVMTGWALLALLAVCGPESDPVRRGVAWLRERQQADGSWPHGAVNGVFFGSAMLDYTLYHSYFPVWALSCYAGTSGHTEGEAPWT